MGTYDLVNCFSTPICASLIEFSPPIARAASIVAKHSRFPGARGGGPGRVVPAWGHSSPAGLGLDGRAGAFTLEGLGEQGSASNLLPLPPRRAVLSALAASESIPSGYPIGRTW
jgi:hypothetical protein